MANNSINEQELIQLILNGNIKLFEHIIKRYQNLVMAITLRFESNENDREEICQEIFIKVYQNLAHFNFDAKLSTWIGRITYNHCINYVKKKSRYTNIELDYSNIEQDFEIDFQQSYFDKYDLFSELEDTEINELIHKYIEKLPVLYRTIINLFHIQEMSYKEISEILDLPQGTVKSYLFRSRKMLKEKLLSIYKEEEFV